MHRASGKGQQLQLQQRSEAPTSEGDLPVLGKELASVDFFVVRSFASSVWVFGIWTADLFEATPPNIPVLHVQVQRLLERKGTGKEEDRDEKGDS